MANLLLYALNRIGGIDNKGWDNGAPYMVFHLAVHTSKLDALRQRFHLSFTQKVYSDKPRQGMSEEQICHSQLSLVFQLWNKKLLDYSKIIKADQM